MTWWVALAGALGVGVGWGLDRARAVRRPVADRPDGAPAGALPGSAAVGPLPARMPGGPGGATMASTASSGAVDTAGAPARPATGTGTGTSGATRDPQRRSPLTRAGTDLSEIADILRVLRSSAVLLDAGDAVLVASPAARTLGLVRGLNLAHAELLSLARAVRADGVTREKRLELARSPLGQDVLSLHARVAPLRDDRVLLLVEDQTQAQRVEAVRRDFVANVSHELKTPVGGISLLAEALMDASDDPEAVERFAERIQVESRRLTQLVQEIMDLSRLQATDSLQDAKPVRVADVARAAADRVATLAEARSMNVAVAVDDAAVVLGDAHMLGTAVDNLLSNAVHYSAERTRVALGVRQVDSIVEITVSDQGQGIPGADLDRIFERFYRVDPARSRATGGTGLGLAIVKHIIGNHGGEVKVWSAVGQGSTFTIRLPAYDPSAEDGPTTTDPSTLTQATIPAPQAGRKVD